MNRLVPVPLFTAAAILFSLLVATSAHAQAPAAGKPAAAPAADSLAAALPLARPLSSGVAIAVDAEWVRLPEGAAPPAPQSTQDTIAGRFGEIYRHFGEVWAIAPSTMVVLNAAPSDPNVYDGMPASDCTTLLLASLSDGQWQQLTSDSGLPVSQLTSDQQQMFAELLPDGKLQVVPWYPSTYQMYKDSDIQDLSDQLPQCSLRIARTISIELPTKDNTGYYGDEDAHPADATQEYRLVGRKDYGGSQDSVYGVPVRATVPNIPKSGQLDFRSPALQAVVPLTGLKTVDDLVTRIGQTTHIELYADPRIGHRSLTFFGPAAAAPAADLLRALALDVTGTYRQVGPAFVLTDDIIGLGTRKLTWYEFEMDADAERAQSVEAAANALFMDHSLKSVSWFDNPLAYAPDQEQTPPDSPSYYYNSINSDFLPSIATTFEKLTPAQQQAVQGTIADHNRGYVMQQTTKDGTIRLNPQISLQIVVPSLPKPVDMNASLPESLLFREPKDVRAQREAQVLAMARKDAAAHVGSLPRRPIGPPLATPVQPARRRAALVDPSTAADVDSDVAAMKKVGLNELWLVVFENGVLRVPGSPLSMPLRPGTGPDILTEALRDTRGTGIKVYPVLDLLYWGQNPPADAVDLDALGENLLQAQTHLLNRQELMPKDQGLLENAPGKPFTGVAVSPASRYVLDSLTQIVGLLAHRPGVAGLVWEGIDPPGYNITQPFEDTGSLLLGYNETMRLAFLRKEHADPVDVYAAGSYLGKANTDLPGFGDRDADKLNSQWHDFRDSASVAFLQGLYAAATSSSPKPEIVVAQRQSYGFNPTSLMGVPFADWDGREATISSAQPPGGGEVADPQALPTIRAEILVERASAGVVVPVMQFSFRSPQGFVVDCTGTKLGSTTTMNQLAAHAPAPNAR